MFGYVKPLTTELKVKEHAFYQSVYCGLCRANGKKTGCLSRFALRYDLVFLALVRMAVADVAVNVKSRRCIAHPLRRRPMTEPCEPLEYAALAGALLAVKNLDDKIGDTRGMRKFAYRSLSPLTCKMRRRAASLGELAQKVSRCLDDLQEIEQQNLPSPDRAADTFGALLGEIFAYGLDGADARISFEIGRHTGRWIYLIDAADDLPSDRKSGSYNPFSTVDPSDVGHIRRALYLELAELEKAADLLTCEDQGILSIIHNIISLGMPSETDRVLQKTFPIPTEKELSPEQPGANGQ